jgi:hypothetical protein
MKSHPDISATLHNSKLWHEILGQTARKNEAELVDGIHAV